MNSSELEQRVKDLELELQKKNDIVIQQSKLATMGEMLDSIAHQWRQPLMEISTILINAETKLKVKGSLERVDMVDCIDNINQITKFMSHTIEDFRNFLSKNKIKEEFILAEVISFAVNMFNHTIKSSDIKFNIIIKKNFKINGYRNEYLQVLINIISNAIDILNSKEIENKTVSIKIYEERGKSVVEIVDNGGGIDVDPIEDIFQPFSSFKKNKGSGIGLFMSKLIIEENMNGKLIAQNSEDGAQFKIIL